MPRSRSWVRVALAALLVVAATADVDHDENYNKYLDDLDDDDDVFQNTKLVCLLPPRWHLPWNAPCASEAPRHH